MRKPGPSPSRQDCRDHQDHPEERDEERACCGSCDYEEYGESEEAEVQLTVVPVKGFLTVHAGLRRSQKLQRVEETSREGNRPGRPMKENEAFERQSRWLEELKASVWQRFER